jgi:hypothetical protein
MPDVQQQKLGRAPQEEIRYCVLNSSRYISNSPRSMYWSLNAQATSTILPQTDVILPLSKFVWALAMITYSVTDV